MRIHFHKDSAEAEFLLKRDPTLKPLFDKTEHVSFEVGGDHFMMLVDAIIGQQLSSKAAASILIRVKEHFENNITPEKILAAKEDELRDLGLSWQKVSYLCSLAELTKNGEIDFKRIERLSDREITEMLIRVKGIGKWTVEMFLLFSLGRRDVFSSGDLGIRNALKKLYQREFTPKEAERLAERWKPYRSMVTHFLWHYLED